MIAFVTGGSGFVGGNLIVMLRKFGWEVRALARSDAACSAVRSAGAAPVRGDLDSSDVLQEGMRGCGAVFHSAALMKFWGHDEDMWRANVDGTRNTLIAALKAGVPCFVFISAAAVISEGAPVLCTAEDVPIPETTFGHYARTKAVAEKMVIEANAYNFRTVAVRPPAIWGSGDVHILPELTRAVRKRRFVWIDGGNYPYATCHVKNVCEGAILAAEKGRGGESYFLTDGEKLTFRQFVTDLLATQGVQPGGRSISRSAAWRTAAAVEWLWRALKLGMPPPLTRSMVALVGGRVVLNDGKARRELGYRSCVGRQEGLEELRRLIRPYAPAAPSSPSR